MCQLTSSCVATESSLRDCEELILHAEQAKMELEQRFNHLVADKGIYIIIYRRIKVFILSLVADKGIYIII